MRYARITLLLLLLVGAASFVTYKIVRSHAPDMAGTFFTTADDRGHCTSWGHGRGADSTTYTAWCESDRVYFYCTAGAARWEKDKDGNWTNLNDPKCEAKLNLNAKPAPAPAPSSPAAPPAQPPVPPPAVTPPAAAAPPAPPPSSPPAAPAPDAGSAAH